MRKSVSEDHFGTALRRVQAWMQESQHATGGPIAQARPNADPKHQTAASLHSFNVTGRLVFGMITDTTAIANCYRVQFEKLLQPKVAVLATQTSLLSSGARQLNTLRPGTMVICLDHEQLQYATIIAVVPYPASAADKQSASVISQTTRARVDEGHARPLRLHGSGGVHDMLAGRPYDSTTVGEAGWITETGLRVFIDPFMAQLGLDEYTGLTVFYHDMLTRLGGYNFQLWTAGSIREAWEDEGELQDISSYAVYPWEHRGLLEHQTAVRELPPEQWQKSEPYYGSVESIDDYMRPFHRVQEYRGYLGQGGMRCLVAPPQNGEKYVSYEGGRDGVAAVQPGLFAEQITLNGRYMLSAVKSISISKRPVIHVPVQRRKPEDPQGDKTTNYRASGLTGDGVQHEIKGSPEVTGDHPNVARAAGLLDLHAYIFNYAGTHPFHYHAEDYYLPEDTDATWAQQQSHAIPNFSALGNSMYLTGKDHDAELHIDHRLGKDTISKLPCGIDFLEDGGVVLYDGYGSEIRMTGGSITMSCPGDVWLKPGRNMNAWAGKDMILRAKNSCDITTTDRDVRIKSERNMQLVAGNSGTGGVLIESRATGPVHDYNTSGEAVRSSGVVLRATNSDVATLGQYIYMRTGVDGGGGDILIDAAGGNRSVITHSNFVSHFVKQNVLMNFGTTPDDTDAVTFFSKNSSVISGTTVVNGNLFANGSVILDGNVLAAGGHFFSERSEQYSSFCGTLKDYSLQQTYDTLEQAKEVAETELTEAANEIWTAGIEPEFYAENRPGNEQVRQQLEGSLRSVEDYGTSDFALYEDRWQQLGRISQKASQTWAEKPVTSAGRPTYPYPGKENYEGDKLMTQDLTLFDAEQQRNKPRGTAGSTPNAEYTEPAYGELVATSLHQYYVIT